MEHFGVVMPFKRRIEVSYFTQDEFKCPCCGEVTISAFLIHQLNRIREALGLPMIVTSGYRCKCHNEAVGGKPNSAHRNGTAADIKCNTSSMRFTLVRLALEVGFTRIGIGRDFVHLDVDDILLPMVLWVY